MTIWQLRWDPVTVTNESDHTTEEVHATTYREFEDSVEELLSRAFLEGLRKTGRPGEPEDRYYEPGFNRFRRR